MKRNWTSHDSESSPFEPEANTDQWNDRSSDWKFHRLRINSILVLSFFFWFRRRMSHSFLYERIRTDCSLALCLNK